MYGCKLYMKIYVHHIGMWFYKAVICKIVYNNYIGRRLCRKKMLTI
jgi:hypothetical protein